VGYPLPMLKEPATLGSRSWSLSSLLLSVKTRVKFCLSHCQNLLHALFELTLSLLWGWRIGPAAAFHHAGLAVSSA
jgi:hypothetical protein